MSETTAGGDFAPIASAFYEGVRDYLQRDGRSGAAAALTVETNSALIGQRADLLSRLLREECGVASVRGLRILDAGCGFGALGARFAADGASVVGIDVMPEPLEVGRAVAAEHHLDLELLSAPMQDLSDLPHTSFDLVVVNNSFCFVTEPRARRRALGELLRLLLPGGWLVARDPNRLTPVDPFTRLPGVALLPWRAAARIARILGRTRSEVLLTSPFGMRRELLAAGFSPARIAYLEGPAKRPPLGWFARYHHVVGRRPPA